MPSPTRLLVSVNLNGRLTTHASTERLYHPARRHKFSSLNTASKIERLASPVGSTTMTLAGFLHVIICIQRLQLPGIITLRSFRGWYSLTREANYEMLRSQQGLQTIPSWSGYDYF